MSSENHDRTDDGDIVDVVIVDEEEQEQGQEAAVKRPSHRRSPLRRSLWILGWLLILAALGVTGYLIQQQWTESSAAGRAQDDLADRFEDRLHLAQEGASPETDTRPTVAETTTPAVTVPEEQTALTQFAEADDIPVMLAPPGGGDGPVMPEPAPGLQVEVAPPESDALGRIEIPAIDIDWMIVEGVSPRDLARAPGHMPGTVVPGQFGNAVISGHRTTNGAPFGDLDLLKPGDEIFIDTVLGTHVYEVVGTRIVAPTELWVTSQWSGSWLTLTTCHPKFSAAQRLVVFAHLAEGPNADVILGLYPGPYQMPEPDWS